MFPRELGGLLNWWDHRQHQSATTNMNVCWSIYDPEISIDITEIKVHFWIVEMKDTKVCSVLKLKIWPYIDGSSLDNIRSDARNKVIKFTLGDVAQTYAFM